MAILTNLPASEVSAPTVATLYAQRWTVEKVFGELAQALQGELNTLCYPRAALLAFSVALVSYNVLSVLKAALRARWGRAAEQQVSTYYLADEISSTYRGMTIAIPESQWRFFEELTAPEMGRVLVELAGRVDLAALRSHPRGPKRAGDSKKRRSGASRSAHVSTARLLASPG